MRVGDPLPRLVLHHRHAGHALLGGEDRCRGCASGRRRTRRGLRSARSSEQGEVGGEAFAQPDIVPVLLGDGIAEPLVGDLVRHQVRTPARPVTDVLAVEDGAGVLHAAAARPRHLHAASFS